VQQPLFYYSAGDYVLNGSGGVATATDLTLIILGSPSGKISYWSRVLSECIADGTAVFNNDMRIVGDNMGFLDQLLLTIQIMLLTTGKHHVWLNLRVTQGFSQTLVGYIDNGTNGF
jgi:hypothetical protein